MATLRKILPETMDEGKGVTVRRLFPVAGRLYIDPFVLLDEFFVPADAGFPDHPHRGFEAVTYLLDGQMHHRDNLGNDSVMGPDGAQCFTAGRGIVHSEMPEGEAMAHGLQLWINLAQKDKGIAPAYQAVSAEAIPEHIIGNGRLRHVFGNGSPLVLHSAARLDDIRLEQGERYHPSVENDWQGFLYVITGSVRWGELELDAGEAATWDALPDTRVEATTPTRFVIAAGQPHNEPVRQHGTYVD